MTLLRIAVIATLASIASFFSTHTAISDVRIPQAVTVDHNNSLMHVESMADGSLTISYARPRPGLEQLGIDPGTILFRGRINGGEISGEARTFKRGCAPAPYLVAGTLDGDTIVLRGPSPVRTGCSVERLDPGGPHAVLVFTGRPSELAGLVDQVASTTTNLSQSRNLREAILHDPYSMVALGPRLHEGNEGIYADFLSLHTCQLLIGDIGSSPQDFFIERVHWTAYYHYSAQHALSAAGYPSHVWDDILQQLTTTRIAVLATLLRQGDDLVDENVIRAPLIPLENRLITALNEYRINFDPSLSEPQPLRESCGGDYMGYVQVETEPTGGTVRLIREYYFKLCEVMGISPYADRCDAWVSAGRGQEFPVGLYRYMAHWSGSHPECDRVMLEEPDAYRGEVGTFVIGRSGIACSGDVR